MKKEEALLQSQLKILYIDDHSALCESLAQVLEAKEESLKVYTANNVENAIECMKQNTDIQIILLDLNLNSQSGLELITPLRNINPDLKVIIYTMHADPLHIEQALKCSIQGYITKEIKTAEIIRAILNVANGSTVFNRESSLIMNSMLNGSKQKISNDVQELFFKYSTLTVREQEIFSLLANEKDVYEIAKTLALTVKTIQNQKSMIYQKMNFQDRLDVIRAAKKLGVIL